MNKAIIYDDSCPLCVLYTTWFIKKGWLPKNGRISFSELEESYFSMIDQQKSKHYIPYVDPEKNKVWYGPEALVQILKPRFPILEKLYNISALKKLAHIAYDFISYNRRVIAAQETKVCNFDCAPEFNKSWRLAFIVFATTSSALLFKSVLPIIVLPTFIMITHLIAKTKFKHNQEKQYNLTGYFATCLLIAGLAFTPFHLLSNILGVQFSIYIGITLSILIGGAEMKRRLKLL